MVQTRGRQPKSAVVLFGEGQAFFHKTPTHRQDTDQGGVASIRKLA